MTSGRPSVTSRANSRLSWLTGKLQSDNLSVCATNMGKLVLRLLARPKCRPTAARTA